jgi:beta-glucanase (GH16 family)
MFHEFAIRWSAASLEFIADGKMLDRWTQDYPLAPMRLMASIWWPRWLTCTPIPEGRELHIDWIRMRPF